MFSGHKRLIFAFIHSVILNPLALLTFLLKVLLTQVLRDIKLSNSNIGETVNLCGAISIHNVTIYSDRYLWSWQGSRASSCISSLEPHTRWCNSNHCMGGQGHRVWHWRTQHQGKGTVIHQHQEEPQEETICHCYANVEKNITTVIIILILWSDKSFYSSNWQYDKWLS